MNEPGARQASITAGASRIAWHRLRISRDNPIQALIEIHLARIGGAHDAEPAVYLDLLHVSRRGTQPKPAALDFVAGLKRAAARLAG